MGGGHAWHERRSVSPGTCPGWPIYAPPTTFSLHMVKQADLEAPPSLSPLLVITMFVFICRPNKSHPTSQPTPPAERASSLVKGGRRPQIFLFPGPRTVLSHFHNGCLTGASRLSAGSIALITASAQEQISASLTYREKREKLPLFISQSERQANTGSSR